MKSVGRLATYLQGYGDLLVRTNGWDPAVLERFRADPVVSGFLGGIDVHGHHRTTRAHRHPHARRVVGGQRHRLAPSECVEAVRGQLALGCDGVILHGATPEPSSSRSSPPTPGDGRPSGPGDTEGHDRRPVGQQHQGARPAGAS